MRYPFFSAMALAAVVVLSSRMAFAQERPRLAQRGQVFEQQGFRSLLPLVKEIPSRPQIGPDGIDSLLQISSIDGEFEIIAGQARYLILKRDLARPDGQGKVRPLVAAGNSTIIDLDIIHSRLIRVVGRRIGATDLTILLDDNSLYTLRVHVVYDLETLRSRLSQQFPEVQIPLRQTRETITVSGMAPDPLDMRNVIRMIRTNADAEQSVLLGRTTGGGGAPAPAAGPPAPVAPR